MYKVLKKVLFLMMLIVLVSCSNKSETKIKENNNKKAEIENNDIEETLKERLDEWNKFYNKQDTEKLMSFYGEKIKYYGKELNKNKVLEDKITFFNENTDYFQEIASKLQIDKVSEIEYKILFLKRATINQKTKDYPSYISFKKIENEWRIIEEGDKVTDKNLEEKTKNKSKSSNYESDLERRMKPIDEKTNNILENSVNGYEINRALLNSYEHWDREINAIYNLLRNKLSENKKIELRNEERAWIKSRDNKAALESEKAENDIQATVFYNRVLVEEVRKRTFELARMYDNLEQ